MYILTEVIDRVNVYNNNMLAFPGKIDFLLPIIIHVYISRINFHDRSGSGVLSISGTKCLIDLIVVLYDVNHIM